MSCAFDPADYPHGCQCSCCSRPFEAGDTMVDRQMGEIGDIPVTTPTCEFCAAVDAPLAPDHPFREGRSPILRADGTVG